MNILSDIDKGYVAGMLDGEGSITWNSRPYYRIHISNNIKESLDHIRDVLGVGMVYKQRNDHGFIYRYCLNRQEHILELLTVLMPALIIKKKKARAAIKILTRSKSLDTSPL